MAEALNLQSLAAELKNAGSPWEMDPTTDMAMMTEDERQLRLGVTPPPGAMSFEEAVAAADRAVPMSAQAIAMEATAAAAPAAYDLRNVDGRNFTTPVKNQGGCGSCVAFGTVAVIETTTKRSRNDPNLKIDLSEAQMFYCYAKEEGRNCGNGWWPDNAFKKAKAGGVTFESHFPYTAGNQACNLSGAWRDDLATPTGHTRLDSRAKMKEWISTRGSVTGCFVVYQDFYSYRSGVYRHVSGKAVGGHCIEIVGYSDADGCWICKNSWGANWGEGGFFRIAYGQCNIENWSGIYGVVGVNLRMWNRDARVDGLWSNDGDRNAWVHLAGIGWGKVAATTIPVQHTMLAELITAKTAHRRVDALRENNVIQQVYVI